MYCEKCVLIHCEDHRLVKEFCAFRAANEGFSNKAASILRGELFKFAGFALARGKSLLKVEHGDIEAYLDFLRSTGGDVLVAPRKRSKLRKFYSWLLTNKRINLDPTA